MNEIQTREYSTSTEIGWANLVADISFVERTRDGSIVAVFFRGTEVGSMAKDATYGSWWIVPVNGIPHESDCARIDAASELVTLRYGNDWKMTAAW